MTLKFEKFKKKNINYEDILNWIIIYWIIYDINL